MPSENWCGAKDVQPRDRLKLAIVSTKTCSCCVSASCRTAYDTHSLQTRCPSGAVRRRASVTNTSGRSSPVPGLADLNPNVALPSIFHAGLNAAEFSTNVTWLMDALTCKRNINCARYLLLGITPSCQVISSNKLHFGLDLFKGGVHAAKPPANAKRELTCSGRCPAREGVSMVSSNEKDIATVYTDQKFRENLFFLCFCNLPDSSWYKSFSSTLLFRLMPLRGL